MFVLPSIIFALLLVTPCLWAIYSKLQHEKLGFSTQILPDTYAVIQGLAVGILIPALSAIIPIQRALSKSLTDALNVARS